MDVDSISGMNRARLIMNRQKAFTLVELISVVSIIVLLLTFLAPSLRNSDAVLLGTTGVRLDGLMEAWRQTAIMSRQPVAVAMLAGDNAANQHFTAMRWFPESSGTAGVWKQISKWESLSEGILSDKTDSSGNYLGAFLPDYSPDLNNSLPNLVYEGVTYRPGKTPGYGYIVFLPDGSLYQDAKGPPVPCKLRLVAGMRAGESIGYHGLKNNDGRPANYFEIVLNASGRSKVVRP